MGKTVSKVNPQRKRVRFSKEFKLEAVRLLELGQKPATDLAMELGIARSDIGSGSVLFQQYSSFPESRRW